MMNQIMEGITICLKAIHFTLESELYSQEKGLVMGSPISPILAGVYMEEFEKRAGELELYTARIWWRYVDDTFVIIRKDTLQGCLRYTISLDRHIKCTLEIESADVFELFITQKRAWEHQNHGL